MTGFVALQKPRHYNARATHRPAVNDSTHDATHRRFTDGRGVFSAGDKGLLTFDSGASSVHLIVRVLLVQLGLGTAIAALFWGTGGHIAGYSALLGGLTCVVPNAFLALRLAVPRRDPGARALLHAAYIGELGKLALTLLMFGTVFALVRPLEALPLFAGFIACQLATFSGLLMRDKVRATDRTDGG